MARIVVEPSPWLRSRAFDAGFIGGTTALALGSALLVVLVPALFVPILLLDVWLLGYHHVVATFTRFLTDPRLVERHRDLLTWWPLGIAAAVAAIGLGIGPWLLATIYLYWQWFHYARQSWGIARIYERKAEAPLPESPLLLVAIFTSVPVWGILHRSSQRPDQFLLVDVWTVPVPGLVVDLVGLAALGLVAVGAAGRWRAWRHGRLPAAHTLMVASHLLVFAVGYVVIDDIDTGWLAINIWHNAQYIAFVWHTNNRQVAGQITDEPRPRLLQRLSADGRLLSYLGLSVAASTVIYLTLDLTLAAVVTPVIVFQAINFHHYVVDGRIWRRPDAPRRRLRVTP